jgi:hypothetical protein
MSTSRTAIISKIKWRLNNSGFSQDLECVDLASMYPYQSTTPGYFVVGVNELGAADPQRGRLFF